MQHPRPWEPGARDSSDADELLASNASVSNKSRASNQAQATLDRLARYRRALNHWYASGADGPMPQPKDHGVRLPDLDPAQVLWVAT